MLNGFPVLLTVFDQEVADSPIIDQDKQFFCMISIAYGF
ncbi:MAG: hypothetical protein D3910_28425 [Candidatus Electrothrix sp. ATG2]|nr:hypothetical protein [Candidatus Electrothrix sp. ATG2]